MVLRRFKQRRRARLYPVIFRWDLDKTYLKSEFDSLRQLMRVPFEKAQDKVAVPGVVPLIKGLHEAATQAGREVRVHFMSASPPQIAKAIRQKLALDGIEYDGIVFKNQLQHLVRGRFRNLREQVGFKLTELLKSRPNMPVGAREVLFGDDWESDPIIYSLYADVLAGRMAPGELGDVLRTIGVDPRLIGEAQERAAVAQREEAVEKIYINLERRTPPTTFRCFGPRLVPTFNYFQTAVCLFEDGYLTLPAIVRVAEAMVRDAGYTPGSLANSLADIARRGHLQATTTSAVREYLRAHVLIPASGRRSIRSALWQRLKPWLKPKPISPAPRAEAIDYHALVTHWRAAR
jgi:hypothetical protein